MGPVAEKGAPRLVGIGRPHTSPMNFPTPLVLSRDLPPGYLSVHRCHCRPRMARTLPCLASGAPYAEQDFGRGCHTTLCMLLRMECGCISPAQLPLCPLGQYLSGKATWFVILEPVLAHACVPDSGRCRPGTQYWPSIELSCLNGEIVSSTASLICSSIFLAWHVGCQPVKDHRWASWLRDSTEPPPADHI